MISTKKPFTFLEILQVILICVILSGCSKENDEKSGNDNPVTNISASSAESFAKTATASPLPESGEKVKAELDRESNSEPGGELLQEPGDIPTPVPITGSEFLKKNYESLGQGNVYRLPFNDFQGSFELMAARFAGDYALFWITRISDDFSEGIQSGEYLILTKPASSIEQSMIPVDAYFSYITVLEDGTVLAAEWDTSLVRVYDDKFTLVRSFLPGKDGASKIIGFTKDGTVWTANEEESKLIATDISGEPLGEYPYDSTLRVTQYLNDTNGKSCFETVSNDENYIHGFLFIPDSSGEITYSGDYEPELGEDLEDQDIFIDGIKIIESDSTWFLHEPGKARDMVVFPKSETKEEYSYIQGKKLCTQINNYTDGSGLSQEFRLYDIDNITVSDTMKNSEIFEDVYLYPKGIMEDSIVVFYANVESEGNVILLWDASDQTTEIEDFCDFSKQDPEKYLSEQLEKLKQRLGIVITPDKYEDSKSPDLLGKIVLSIDFVNSFKVGTKYNPEVLASKSCDYIHPENMRNNDGTKHTFNPHVFSDCYLNVHGEKAMETFFNYVDAVRAGEERFECPDPDAVGWVSGRFATYFYPVLNCLTNTEYLGKGQAKIYYLIPKEELLEKISDFEKRICDILDDVIEDDYTDFEKTLALYEFMTEYCTYDYVALNNRDAEWLQQESGYRVLMEKQGICWEISCLYKYLLLQCGVDIEEASGVPVDPGGESHQWNYVVLDGQAYLIDATWGLSDKRKPDLKYFLFTDEIRAERDGFKYESFKLADYQLNDMPEPYPYDAVDDRFHELWSGKYLAFDQNEKCIFYWDENDVICRFDY